MRYARFYIGSLLCALLFTGVSAPAKDAAYNATSAKYIPLFTSNNIALPLSGALDDYNINDNSTPHGILYYSQLSSGFDVPMVLNNLVWSEIEYYQQRPGRVRTILERGASYLPIMKQALFEEGCPRDMAYLPMIESAFIPTAKSVMSAAGLWQFMESTGRLYGLQKDDWVDERLDIVKSSHAAARFMLDLYDRFGDWSLVLAAYNAGPGAVSSAIRKENATDFWKMSDTNYLHGETKGFVPRFYAALMVGKYPERFGVPMSVRPTTPDFISVKTPPLTDLAVVAEISGASYDSLTALNPQYLNGCTPPRDGEWSVLVPKDNAAGLQQKLAALNDQERNKFPEYEVKKRETLERIARVFKVNSKLILQANGLTSRRDVRSGMVLTIPARRKTTDTAVATSDTPSIRKTATGAYCVRYSVAAGETMFDIAAAAGVAAEEISKWNDVDKNAALNVGRVLLIYCDDYETARKLTNRVAPGVNAKKSPTAPRKFVYHTIKPGESLWGIASKYKISVSDLSDWNEISDPRLVRAGQKIKIFK